MLDIEMPKKIRLLAMKTLLSARLAEGNILIVDNDDLPERKTKHVAQMISNFVRDERCIYVAGQKNEDFEVASRGIQHLTYTTFGEVRLTDILKADKLVFNLDGILNLTRYLHEQTVVLHKPRAVPFAAPLLTELKKAADAKQGKAVEEKVR